MNNLPIVAIVGPANAGKSTLLNKIVGRPLAVTADMPGTTRDRQYADVFWNGRGFTLVDTAGLILNENNELETNVKKQIEVALFEAKAIILVVDGKQPAGSLEEQILKKFRKIKTVKILAINKIDSQKQIELKEAEFSRFGIRPAFAVSALTGRGIGDLLDEVVKNLPQEEALTEKPKEKPEQIKISIVGKPNVGKSSLFNKILKNERAVVSAIAGTTRTSVDSEVTLDGETYTFIDTAGLKKKEFRQTQADIFSGFQTFKSIRRSDICLFVLDAAQEITKQDQRVANEIFAMEKGCIILANKIDLLTTPIKDKKSEGLNKNKRSADDEYGSFRDLISHHFPFLWMSPLFFVSAETGEGLEEALKSIKPIYQARHKTIDQETLEKFLQKKLKINPPKLLRDQKQPKVFGLTQTDTNPATFELYVNHPAAISMQFRKFLENGIIRDLGFWGTPIKLKLRGKDKK